MVKRRGSKSISRTYPVIFTLLAIGVYIAVAMVVAPSSVVPWAMPLAALACFLVQVLAFCVADPLSAGHWHGHTIFAGTTAWMLFGVSWAMLIILLAYGLAVLIALAMSRGNKRFSYLTKPFEVPSFVRVRGDQITQQAQTQLAITGTALVISDVILGLLVGRSIAMSGIMLDWNFLLLLVLSSIVGYIASQLWSGYLVVDQNSTANIERTPLQITNDMILLAMASGFALLEMQWAKCFLRQPSSYRQRKLFTTHVFVLHNQRLLSASLKFRP